MTAVGLPIKLGESPMDLKIPFVPACSALKEMIKSLVKRSGWCITEYFYEAVPCSLVSKNITILLLITTHR